MLNKKYFEQSTYSPEGIIDTILSIFKRENKEDKTSVKEAVSFEGKRFSEIEKILNETYLNDKWIDKRNITEGEVVADDISKYIFKNGEYKNNFLSDIKDHIKAVDDFLEDNIVIAKEYDKFIEEKDNFLKENYENTDEFLELMKKVTKKIAVKEKELKLTGKLDQSKLLYPIKVNGDKVTVKMTTDSKTKSLPKLNKEQIKEAGHFVIKMINKDEWYPSGTDHSDGHEMNEHDEYDGEVYVDYYGYTYHQALWDILSAFYDENDYYGDFSETVRAILYWIERSLK